jgi:hypothetical protein
VRYATPMATTRGSVLHQQALTVMGLFTGLTLACLVLILNSPHAFHTAIGPLNGDQYFGLISTYVAIEGAVSSVAMVAFLEVAGGLSRLFSFIDKLGTTLFFVSVFGFLGVLPLLLAAFTEWGAIGLIVIEAVLLGLYFVGRRLPMTDPRGLSESPEEHLYRDNRTK